MIRLGAIGAGAVFQEYERAAEALPGLALVAVADSSPRRREEATRAGRRGYAGVEGLLAEALDAVLVLTPNAAHAPVVEACLERGLDTLCEKPLATTPAAAEALLALAGCRGVLLYTAMHCRHRPEVRYASDHLAGTVIGFEQTYREDWRGGAGWYYAPRESGGGVLLDVGINQIDWLLPHVPGLRPEAVRARLGETGVETDCEIDWTFAAGRGSTALSWRGVPERKVTRLTTDAGSVLELDHGSHSAVHDGRRLGPWHNDEYSRVLREFLSLRSARTAYRSNTPELLHLLRGIYGQAGLPFLAEPQTLPRPRP